MGSFHSFDFVGFSRCALDQITLPFLPSLERDEKPLWVPCNWMLNALHVEMEDKYRQGGVNGVLAY